MREDFKDIVFHIDVNNAFLSWEAIRRLRNGEKLDIRKVPSVIGGSDDFDIKKPNHRQGVVLAKSIPAKKFNIVTGEALWIAFQKCPNLIRISPDFKLYKESSKTLIELISSYTPHVDRYSIDECFAYFDGCELLYESPMKLALQLQKDINDNLGIDVNIGISSNRLLAKMASDFEKPNKIHSLFPEEIQEKLWHLKVNELFMCGKSTTKILNEIGIYTIGQLARADEDLLKIRLKSFAKTLIDYANGIESRALVDPNREISKSIGNSTTLRKNINSLEEAKPVFKQLAYKVGMRLRSQGLYANQISVNVKNSNFISYSHQKKLRFSIDSDISIYHLALELFEEMWKGDSLRLLGISVGDFTHECIERKERYLQGSLLEFTDFEKDDSPLKKGKSSFEVSGKIALHHGISPKKKIGKSEEALSKLNHTLDELRKKYGDDII